MTTRAQMSEAEKHEHGHNDLMCAALEGNTATVKRLLEIGLDVNAKDDEGRTALMFAVTNLHHDTVNLLLENGADVNLSSNDGCTALMLAASANDVDLVHNLMRHGADVTGKFHDSGKTALALAEEKGNKEIVKLLQVARAGGSG